MFIIEVLAIQNSFLKEEKLIIKRASMVEQKGDRKESQEVLLSGGKWEGSENEAESEDENNKTKVCMVEKEDNFYIFQRFEISKLANKIFSKPLYFFVVMVMVGYLYVGVTSNGIIAGNSLKDIIGITIGSPLPDYYYEIILVVFFAMAIAISLNNINKLRQFSLFIIACRFCIIILIIAVCIHTMIDKGPANLEQVPKFNIENITIMIGNSLFFFMSHHSMPGMVENFSPQKKLIKLLIAGYLVALGILITFGYIAIFTFSHYDFCDKNVFPSAIQVRYSYLL
jgi:hypothetical protein